MKEIIDNEEREVVYIVKSAFGLLDVFSSRDKAMELYREKLNTYKMHKPNEMDKWTYKTIHEEESDMSYCIFEATCPGHRPENLTLTVTKHIVK